MQPHGCLFFQRGRNGGRTDRPPPPACQHARMPCAQGVVPGTPFGFRSFALRSFGVRSFARRSRGILPGVAAAPQAVDALRRAAKYSRRPPPPRGVTAGFFPVSCRARARAAAIRHSSRPRRRSVPPRGVTARLFLSRRRAREDARSALRRDAHDPVGGAPLALSGDLVFSLGGEDIFELPSALGTVDRS